MSYWEAVDSIVLTGGVINYHKRTAQTFQLAVKMGRWEQSSSIPDLNVARAIHASMTLRKQCYVACGYGDDDEFLSSVEMLRMGAEAWVLIEIPGLTPRMIPVFSQIDSQTIAILGG